MVKKRVSIKDIAELVGVSHPTVSRALRGKGRMSDETRARILAVAQELGYTPSLIARGLVTQRSYCVGLVVPTFSDPFHSAVAQGIETVARQHSYSLFLTSTEVDAEHEWEVTRGFISRHVDGIIVSSSWVGDRYTDLLQETGIPVVLINPMVQSDRVHTVRHDDYCGGCQLVRHLVETGRRRIAYLGNAQAGQANAARARAWRDVLQEAGLAPELSVLGPKNGIEGGMQAGAQLLQEAEEHWGTAPDALYCYNDAMAIGALSVLRKRGLRVPEDTALTGFDDLDVTAVMQPPLTTLRQPRYQMGARAMQILLALISHSQQKSDDAGAPAPIPLCTRMAGELILRQST